MKAAVPSASPTGSRINFLSSAGAEEKKTVRDDVKSLKINTFSNQSGGNAFYKAVTHPLVADKARKLVAQLQKVGTGGDLRSRQSSGRLFGILSAVGGRNLRPITCRMSIRSAAPSAIMRPSPSRCSETAQMQERPRRVLRYQQAGRPYPASDAGQDAVARLRCVALAR